MRRTIALLTMVAMTLLVATSVAMAAVITCPTANNPPGSPPGTCRGTPSADTMTGTNGTFRDAPGENLHGDIIDSFRGGDTLNARKANDTLDGGQGNDTLNGGQGNDSLDGGEGNDTYLFEYGWGEDTITDASGNDTLDFSKLMHEQDAVVKMVPSSSNNEARSGTNTLNWDSPVLIERIIGGAGRDLFIGSNFGDSLYGAEARDLLDGESGNDTIVGGDDQDLLYGGSGNDTIVGGDGQDILRGESGDDTITATDHRPVGGPETIISCGDGRDTVIYDREFESPDRDCEIRIGLPAIAPPTN